MLGSKWITTQKTSESKKSIPNKWWNETSLPFGQGGTPFGISTTYRKRQFSFGRLFIRWWWWWMIGVAPFWQRLISLVSTLWFALYGVNGAQVLQLAIGSTSFGKFLPKNTILALESPCWCCNASFDQPFNKPPKPFNLIWFFLRNGLPWITWCEHNDLVINILQWHLEKTHQVMWDTLLEWQWTLQ